MVSEDVRHSKEWPKKSQRAERWPVRRLVPNLRRVGLGTDTDAREGGTGRRLIAINKAPVDTSQPSPSSQSPPSPQEQATENELAMQGPDGCDGCDDGDATLESVAVDGKGETEWEA